MPTSSHAVFLSYASEDSPAAQRIAEALRAAGIEVWLDQSELRGGEAWDRQIRKQIHDCGLFIAVISAHSDARIEGYFRREWKLAVERTHDRLDDAPFLVPVVVDNTRNENARVPDKFREVHWTHLPDGCMEAAFVERIQGLLSPNPSTSSSLEVSLHGQARSAAGVAPQLTGTFRTSRWSRAALLVAGVMVALAVGYFVFDRLVIRTHTARQTSALAAQSFAPGTSTVPDKSIAVLPFVDLSEKRDQEYFSAGLSEEILDLLGRIPTLFVVGRTSSFQFRGEGNDLRAVGAKLGAAYVLEGSVRRAADHVRVTAQLINTHDGLRRWSGSYDGSVGDVLRLQEQIAAGVTRAMEITVGTEARRSRSPLNNPEAYDLYLRGLHALDRYDREGLETAVNYFQQSLNLDPTLGSAATSLGRTFFLLADFGFAPVESFARARRELETAVKLDPNSGTAHGLLGQVYLDYEWDWAAADTEFKRALQLSPRDPDVLLGAARLSEVMNHWDDAIHTLTAAIALDPLDAAASNVLSGVYLRAGRLADAEAAVRRVIEINPTFATARSNLAIVLLARERPGEALRVIREVQQEAFETQALILVYHALGRKADSDGLLSKYVHEHANDDAFGIAEACAYRGEVDEAFQWLDKAYAQRDAYLFLVKGDPLLKNLEEDPRYKAFLRKMNLPD